MVKRLCCVPCCPCFREEGSKYCTKHRPKYEEQDNARYQEYLSRRYSSSEGRHYDPRKTKYYNSLLWKNLSKKILSESPICQCCGQRESVHVHHAYPYGYDYWNDDDFFDESVMVALCNECHTAIHEENRNGANSTNGTNSKVYKPKD